jgi:hypothetical protein
MLCAVPLPKMARVRQTFERNSLAAPAAAVREPLARLQIAAAVKPGMRVAVTVGSRGVANVAPVTREIVRFLRARGAAPFVVPAMGSHGGSSAEGQAENVRAYGVTEAFVGCPVVSSMEVAQIGTLEDGKPVYIDRAAAEADGIVPVNRVKAHTAFHSRYESGVMKMMAIGLGKQKGAETVHRDGILHLGPNVEKMAFGVLRNANILFGVGLVENAYDETMLARAMTKVEIPLVEPELLALAKRNMARILLAETDVLLVDYIGKNISGEGMDPNLTGRYIVPTLSGGIRSQVLGVLDITPETLGNFVGLGMADVCAKRVIDKISLDNTYPNSLTSTVTCLCKLPMYFDSHRLTVQAAVKMTPGRDPADVRVVRIRDTLTMGEIEVSENLLPVVGSTPGMEALGAPRAMAFDGNGDLFA